MACGVAHREMGDTRQFLEAVACGQKFENPHFKHYCMSCLNRGSELCEKECFFGSTCHFKDAIVQGEEAPESVRRVVEAVSEAIAEIKSDMLKRGNPAEAATSTGLILG